jgi:hypothetical protein
MEGEHVIGNVFIEDGKYRASRGSGSAARDVGTYPTRDEARDHVERGI